MTDYDKRCCCLREIQQTEEKYTDTLGSIQQVRCPHPAPARRMRGSGRQVRPPVPCLWGHALLGVCLSASVVFYGFHPVLFLSPFVSFPLGILISVSIIVFDFLFSLFPLAIAF